MIFWAANPWSTPIILIGLAWMLSNRVAWISIPRPKQWEYIAMTLRVRDYINICRHRGAQNAACELWDNIVLDWWNGTETALRHKSTRSDYNGYVGLYTHVVSEGLRQLTKVLFSVDLNTFLFVDIGCGKGKPLITAARSFGMRGLGLEISDQIAAVAKQNVRQCGLEDRVVIECCDATEVCLKDILWKRPPLSNFLTTSCRGIIFFAYNPFNETVLLNLINQWVSAVPTRTCFLFFCGDKNVILPFKLKASFPFGRDDTRFSRLYQLA